MILLMPLFPENNTITGIDNQPHLRWMELTKLLLEIVTAWKDKVKIQDQGPKEICNT